jgi:transposase
MPMFRSTRRHFKPEPFWRGLIDRWKASGQSVASFCGAHRVSQATFYSWRKRLASQTRSTTLAVPAFAPVRVVPDPTAEVVLPSGLIVRVPAATDPTMVARLVAALGGATC